MYDSYGERDKVDEAIKDWGDTRTSILHPAMLQARSKSSKSILGIDLPILLAVAKETEISCLRMLLALLEGGDIQIGSSLSERFLEGGEEGILLQNMDNVYNKTFHAGYDERMLNRSTAVLYLTFISTLASLQPDDNSFGIDDLLENWKQECLKEGKNVDLLAASVEIVDNNGKIQRVYFPVPDFVVQYWRYPETQNARKDIV